MWVGLQCFGFVYSGVGWSAVSCVGLQCHGLVCSVVGWSGVCDCCVSLPHCAVGWSAVFDYGISWSYTLVFFIYLLVDRTHFVDQ